MKTLNIGFLLSFSLLAQRKETKESALFQRCFCFFFLEKKQNRMNFSKFLPGLQKFLTKNSCYTAEKI
ncbi:MAG: hypothetical protein AAF617_17730, partial [Bacteroidota bacterium]